MIDKLDPCFVSESEFCPVCGERLGVEWPEAGRDEFLFCGKCDYELTRPFVAGDPQVLIPPGIDTTDIAPGLFDSIFTASKWTLKVGWLSATGRLFVFRDAPTWFVRDWATPEYKKFSYELHSAARKELKARSLQRQRSSHHTPWWADPTFYQQEVTK